jgi:hypothetical protein
LVSWRSTRRDAWVPNAGAYLGTDVEAGDDVDLVLTDFEIPSRVVSIRVPRPVRLPAFPDVGLFGEKANAAPESNAKGFDVA